MGKERGDGIGGQPLSALPTVYCVVNAVMQRPECLANDVHATCTVRTHHDRPTVSWAAKNRVANLDKEGQPQHIGEPVRLPPPPLTSSYEASIRPLYPPNTHMHTLSHALTHTRMPPTFNLMCKKRGEKTGRYWYRRRGGRGEMTDNRVLTKQQPNADTLQGPSGGAVFETTVAEMNQDFFGIVMGLDRQEDLYPRVVEVLPQHAPPA